MPKTLILPGLDGSPAPHWQHWWAATDPNALIVEQTDWSCPSPEAWETEVAGAILTHPDCILVGHSLGAILAARLLSRWPQLRISAALLVAPADPAVSRRLADFAGIPKRPFGIPATVVASNIGMCNGKRAYLTIAWYFPSKGETASAGREMKTCWDR